MFGTVLKGFLRSFRTLWVLPEPKELGLKHFANIPELFNSLIALTGIYVSDIKIYVLAKEALQPMRIKIESNQNRMWILAMKNILTNEICNLTWKHEILMLWTNSKVWCRNVTLHYHALKRLHAASKIKLQQMSWVEVCEVACLHGSQTIACHLAESKT